MTPMVDLGFLLISFFVITTQLTEPKTMDLIVPAKGPFTDIKKSATLTFLPTSDDQLYYYYGDAEETARDQGLLKTDNNGEKLREIISRRKTFLVRKKIDPDELFVIIKPDKQCKYKNVVDLLDEIIIHDVKRYALTDPNAADTELMRNARKE